MNFVCILRHPPTHTSPFWYKTLFFLRSNILSYLKTYNLYYEGKNLQLRHREVRKSFYTLIVWQVGKRLTPSVLSQLFTIVRGVITVCDWRGCASLCGGDWVSFCVCKCSLLRCCGCAKLVTVLEMLYLSFISLIYSKSIMMACVSLKPNTQAHYVSSVLFIRITNSSMSVFVCYMYSAGRKRRSWS